MEGDTGEPGKAALITAELWGADWTCLGIPYGGRIEVQVSSQDSSDLLSFIYNPPFFCRLLSFGMCPQLLLATSSSLNENPAAHKPINSAWSLYLPCLPCTPHTAPPRSPNTWLYLCLPGTSCPAEAEHREALGIDLSSKRLGWPGC